MALNAALENVLQLVDNERDRFRKVALPPYTDPYARLTISEGFARIGSIDRAIELGDSAIALLAREASDPVHGYLMRAYEARIDQARRLLPRDTALPRPMVAHLESLGRVDRYKVDRLREQSPILASDIPVHARHPSRDALGTFARRLVHPPDQARNPTLDALRAIDNAAERATAIEKLIDDELIRAIFLEASCQKVGSCLDALLQLPEAHAMPVVARTIFEAERLRPAIPGPLCAKLVRITARFGYGDLIPATVGNLVDMFRRGESLETLEITLKALRRLGMMEELEQVVGGIAPETDHATAMVVAGVRSQLGDKRGMTDFASSHRALTRHRTGTTRMLELARDIARGATHAELRMGLAQIAKLGSVLGFAVDGFSTNTHFSLSFLHLVESMVLGIADLDLADANVREEVDQAVLSFKPGLGACIQRGMATREGKVW